MLNTKKKTVISKPYSTYMIGIANCCPKKQYLNPSITVTKGFDKKIGGSEAGSFSI